MQDNNLEKICERLTKVVLHFHGDGHGSKKAFCDKIGVSNAMLHSWTIGRHQPTSTYRDKICLAYGVRRSWLDSGAGEMLEKPLSSPEPPNFEPQRLLDEIRELKARLDESRRAFDALAEKCGQGFRHEKSILSGSSHSP